VKRSARRTGDRAVRGPLAGHFKRDGSPKNAYRTEAEARSAAQLAWTLSRADLSTYRCDHCHQWHIGASGRSD
jgi:hypothetical protein